MIGITGNRNKFSFRSCDQQVTAYPSGKKPRTQKSTRQRKSVRCRYANTPEVEALKGIDALIDGPARENPGAC